MNAATGFRRSPLRRQATAAPQGRRYSGWIVAGMAVVALATSGRALAIGLGNVSGEAVLGQPLRVEIPLLGVAGERPAAECFRVRPPQTATEPGYAPKSARVAVVGERGSARLVVSTAAPVREPVVEFGIAVACGFDLTRDYLLLSSPPARVPAIVVPAPVPVSPPVAAASSQPKAPPAVAGTSLRIAGDTTLVELARRNYPLQPKAREKYVRMMRDANPELAVDGVVPAGAQLTVPPGLPLRRESRHRPRAEAAKPLAPARDVLRLGVAPERSPAELLAEAERLAAVLLQQQRMENELVDNLTRLEKAFADLKQHYVSVEERMVRIEAERVAEKAAAKSGSVGLLELLLAVLAGGALGGVGLHAYNRLRPLPDPATQAYDAPTVAAYLGSVPEVVGMSKRRPEKSSLTFTGGR